MPGSKISTFIKAGIFPKFGMEHSRKHKVGRVKSRKKVDLNAFVLPTLILVGCIVFQISESQLVFDGMCPVPECYCGMDFKGRLEVDCNSGGLTEIPTSRMSPGIEVIRIMAPRGHNNYLTIGRFFRQFRKLEELHIVNSNVPNIGENNFWGVTSLKLLNLTRNNINLIIDSNFKGLDNLKILSLSQNSIDSLVSSCFQHLAKLEILDLSRNRITKLVERLFYNLHRLRVLDLSYNRLRELNADVFRDIWRLQEFHCQRCQLKTIPAVWYTLLPNLQRLNLKNNEIKYLRDGEFHNLKSIEEIHLDGNKIKVLSEECFKFTRLKHLSLASNGLDMIHRTAFLNASVHSLDLSGNQMDTLNKLIFLDLRQNLTKLDLSRNPRLRFSSLLSVFSENRALLWVSLAQNNYIDLPLDLFEDNRPLQFLNLSHNRLKDIFPRQFMSLTSLQVLDLSYNKLYGVEENVLKVWDKIFTIREIRLQGNPFACDLCHISPLHRWMQTSPIFRKGCFAPRGPFCLRCKYPSSFYDQAIINLDETNLEWCSYDDEYGDESRLGLILGCGLIFLVLALICGGLVVRYQFWHTAHYYTHEDTRVDTGTTPPAMDYDMMDFVGDCSQYYATINGTHTKMISTIDEKNFEPDANFYPDLTLNLNPLHSSYGGKSPTSACAVSPSIPSRNDHFSNR